MTVLDNVTLGRHRDDARRRRAACALFWGRAQREEAVHREKVEQIIDFLEMEQIRRAPVGTLPYGLQKRVELGRALALEPRLLLLDEPTSGMNVDEKEDIARFILDINEEMGVTLLLVSHDIGVTMDICDRVVVLDQGQQDRRGPTGRGPPRTTRSIRAVPRRCPWSRWPLAPHDTLPQLVVRQRRRAAAADRDAREGVRHLAGLHVGRLRRPGRAHRLRPADRSASKRGDRMAIIGDNRPQLYWACLAAQALGAMPVPLYQDAIADELGYALEHAGVRVVARREPGAGRQGAGGAGSGARRLEHIIFDDPKGMTGYDDDDPAQPRRRSSDAGRAAHDAEPDLVRRPGGGGADRTTSRSSATRRVRPGEPKGVVLTHANLLAERGERPRPGAAGDEGDEGMAYLPMAWIGDTAYSLALSLLAGAVVNCPEDPGDGAARPPRDRADGPHRPAAHLGEPAHRHPHAHGRRRPLQAVPVPPLHRRWPTGSRRSGWRVRRLGAAAGARPARRRRLVYAPLRDQIGLRRIRYAYTRRRRRSGPRRCASTEGIGVNLKQIYGITEAVGPRVRATRRRDQARLGRPPARRRRDHRSPTTARSSLHAAARLPAATTGTPRRPPTSIERRVVPHRRRRVLPRRRPPRRRRPGRRPRRAGGRHVLRPAVHREQAQVQPVREGGGRPRRAARPTSPPSSTSTARASGRWAERAQHPVHELRRPLPAARGARADPRRGGGGQRRAPGRHRRSSASSCCTRSSIPTTARSPAPASCDAA